MDPQIEDEQMWRRNELNYIVAMITKYFSKVIVRFNPFGKEGMYFFRSVIRSPNLWPSWFKDLAKLGWGRLEPIYHKY